MAPTIQNDQGDAPGPVPENSVPTPLQGEPDTPLHPAPEETEEPMVTEEKDSALRPASCWAVDILMFASVGTVFYVFM